jgi:hypothetical protein
VTRAELEHAIRAACDLTGDTEVIAFGSQAILGQFPDAPSALRQSAEADIAPKHATDNVDLIDAILGEDSQFHQSTASTYMAFRFKQQPLRRDGRNAPSKVQNKNTRDFIGWCIEVHDLAASKLVAFREKDLSIRACSPHREDGGTTTADHSDSAFASSRSFQRPFGTMDGRDRAKSLIAHDIAHLRAPSRRRERSQPSERRSTTRCTAIAAPRA